MCQIFVLQIFLGLGHLQKIVTTKINFSSWKHGGEYGKALCVRRSWRLGFSAAAVHVEGVHVHTQPVKYYLIIRSSKNLCV